MRKKQVKTRDRVLRRGRRVQEFTSEKNLPISTHCPEKWIAVDLETGDVWAGSETGWKRASPEEHKEALAIMEQANQ